MQATATMPAPPRRAIERSQAAQARAARGQRHELASQWSAAAACYREALALDPRCFPAALHLPAMLARLRRFDEAEAAYRQATALQPRSWAAWSNLGAMLSLLRRDDDALACLLHALQLAPTSDKARLNLSYLLLCQGRWAEGLLCLEARPSLAPLHARLDAPRWTGDSLAGRSLLVVSDAGHGDLIQMARYATELRSRGAQQLWLYGQPALKRLLAHRAGFDQVLGFDEPLPYAGWDLWTPAMSLPQLCGSRVDRLPNALPYLHPEPARVAHWAGLLAAGDAAGRRRVGLVWRGNAGHQNDADRSLPGLGSLAALGRVPGLRFISLQVGPGADDAGAHGAALAVEPPPAELSDFAETAALIANLDLVIGVDTSTLHLAGALGKPVWVLVPDHMTDWRWLRDRSDSPWYPGVMRLFRQARMGAWAPVVDEVAAALAAW